MEKVKIGALEFELVTNGYLIGKNGGEIIFLPGERTFEEVEDIVKKAESILLVDGDGNPMVSRSDLIFAGRMEKDSHYVIGSKEGGEEIIETVMTAEFRLPDMREELEKTNARLDYVFMMTDLEV